MTLGDFSKVVNAQNVTFTKGASGEVITLFDINLIDESIIDRRNPRGGSIDTPTFPLIEIEASATLSEDVYLGGHWEDFGQIISQEPKFLRLFLGYSGWGAGQLEGEILAGGWEVYNCDLKSIFNQNKDPWKGEGLEKFKQSLMG